MPRPSLAAERTSQILDAMERCVARFGLEGTSLEEVAREAGVKRSILRHYVGNREDLVRAMALRFAERYQEQLRELNEFVGDSPRIERLLDSLFPPTTEDRFRDVLIVEALIAAADQDDEIRSLMAETVENSIATVRDILRLEVPTADARRAWDIAYGVVGIYFNHESLHPLALPRRHRTAARNSARLLIESLGDGR